jgi:membrane fusion protein, multidrug efflux system
VDRGSIVKQGELLAELSAPELPPKSPKPSPKCKQPNPKSCKPKPNSPRPRAPTIGLRKAAETPGAVAGNEVIQSQKQVEAAQALVRARDQARQAAAAAVRRKRTCKPT